jgi:NADH-quinone oxidoreductase subunit E
MEQMPDETEAIRAAVEEVLAERGSERKQLIPILQGVQARLGYLPALAMQNIAAALQIAAVDIYSVATFYNQFRLNPPGKHQIKVCLGTACHMMGGQIALESFERRLGIKEGETTADREFSLERVACVGCCALAPVVVVDERVEPKVSPIRVDGILLAYEIAGKQATENQPPSEKEGEGE